MLCQHKYVKLHHLCKFCYLHIYLDLDEQKGLLTGMTTKATTTNSDSIYLADCGSPDPKIKYSFQNEI